MRSFLSLASLLSVATAHFTLDWPPNRGFDENTMPTFPCGGFNTPASNRTLVSLSEGSIPVDLTFHHSQTAVSVFLGLGNDPGSNFNISLQATVGAQGLGEFCFSNVPLDQKTIGVALQNGQNATLQVVTNGDTTPGLFACADITFSSTVTTDTPTTCKNNTGVSATPFSGAAATRPANLSTPQGQAQGGSSSPSSASTTAASAAATSTGAAVPMQTAGWGILGAAIVGGLAVL